MTVLATIKKMLGIESTCTEFDEDIIIYINSSLFKLHDLGVTDSSTSPVVISSSSEWSSIIGTDAGLEAIKTYIYLNVRLLFDPPASSFAVDAIKTQIEELGWRLYESEDTRRLGPGLTDYLDGHGDEYPDDYGDEYPDDYGDDYYSKDWC